MKLSDTNDIKSIKFSVFRAVDNISACQKFIEGHIHVLKVYGITQITSAKIDWILNPNVYVLIAESADDKEVLAGARIHIADGKNILPIEDAIGTKDPKVFGYIEKLRLSGGTGELCGLWNSRKIAGFGIGSMFLGRTSVAFAGQLGISTLVALCAPTTKDKCFLTGFRQETSLGDMGEFIYPKEDLIATSLIIPDLSSLTSADAIERDKIVSLRSNWNQKVIEETKRGMVQLEYRLEVPHIPVNLSA